ncbi:MAG TPA: type II toxin-antitoxin system prevent-host-death family antitoxin [Dehalococcoidia bacterium]|nr:type II toxin-antitoxin system prevent-host-death family antitoxin [Dehalococcoidia bacterium]
MKRTLSAVEARKRLGEILEGVFYRGDEVIIERAGKPMAVVIPARVYETMTSNRDELFKMIEEIHERNRDVPPEVIQAEIDEAIREVRREKQKSTDR